MSSRLILCTKCQELNTPDRMVKNTKTLVSGEKRTYIIKTCYNCDTKYKGNYKLVRKNLVFDYYGNKCACCGENNELFLTIDHINNDGNKEVYESNGRRITGAALYGRIIRNGYPDTYQLLCMNCNFGKRMNKGVCPHNNYL